MDKTKRFPIKMPKWEDIVLYEDEDLLVVNKPPFVSTLDDRQGDDYNMLRMAKDRYGDIQVCHRLDKETSGVLVYAKSKDVYREVAMAFEKRTVDKTYHAVIEGNHHFDHLKVDLPILNLGNRNVKIDKNRGKEALTFFNSLQFFQHYTLIECKPITGKMHQIRIHLASQMASIVGDEAYGGKPVFLSKIKRKGYSLKKGREEEPLIKRFALHAKSLGFTILGKKFEFEAPYPKDFEVLVKSLSKYDS